MISTKTRLQLEEIARRIANKEPVSLAERQLISKWADNNRTVYEMLRKAQREAFVDKSDRTSVFLHELNLGDPDPSNYKSGFDGPDDIGGFFHAPYWTRRD